MSYDKEPSLRQQLIDARKSIIAQLDELNFRATASFARHGGGPPDYGPMVAELQGQLHEINELLGIGGESDL